jgi:adenine-specific DNA-methyltransferase
LATASKAKYEYDPHINPALQWAGKAEGGAFAVAAPLIHVHEFIKPHKIIRSVRAGGELQGQLFASDDERASCRDAALGFYGHRDGWVNRLIAGDSLVVMRSLREKEGMSGLVQTVYVDPPYGIKYGSRFRHFADGRNAAGGSGGGVPRAPERVRAFRDTWEWGIHSYLSYLRDRLVQARELLADSGSVFVQMSDENVHLARCICDEVFGKENFSAMIYYRTTGGFETNSLSRIGDSIIWYAKDKARQKYRQLFEYKDALKGDSNGNYRYIQLASGERRPLSLDERNGKEALPSGGRLYRLGDLTSQRAANMPTPIVFNGKVFNPQRNNHWKPSYPNGLQRLADENRIVVTGETLSYVRFLDDFPVMPINNVWLKTGLSGFSSDKQYVVQTNAEVVQRCLLMTTDPGDLVLDITCGSGTTAYVAEQWGRRWITCDTSRVAIALAKKRLMTAVYDCYKLACPKQGVSGGFVCRTVPHVTLKSIANREPPETETLFDQPKIEKKKARISGPFTVEAIPAPTGAPDGMSPGDCVPCFYEDWEKKQADWIAELMATGILGSGGAGGGVKGCAKIGFSRVEALEGGRFIHAEAVTNENPPKRAVVCFAGETRPLDVHMVNEALAEAVALVSPPQMIIFAAFQFDPAAAKLIDDTGYPTLLKAHMNIDLMTAGLKKNRRSNQSFWLVGQPDVEFTRIAKGGDGGKYKVKIRGFDYYDVEKDAIVSGGPDKIAMWMLDTDYDGTYIDPVQVFFPPGGKNEGWKKLAKALSAEIDHNLIEKYHGTESLPFAAKQNALIAVKIVDDRGLESLKVIPVGEK